ncbi:hypothetical protein ACFX1Q_020386 [Malus domestica]
MTVISQLEVSSSRQACIPTNPIIPSWANKFANSLLGQPPVVVEGARGTFTLESGVTKVFTNLYSNLNVKYMDSMGKLVGKQLDARTIKWKLGLTWGDKVKNPFYLDHFGHRWYAIEFTDEDELEFALNNRPWYVRGKIFHMERWHVHFQDRDFISNLRVWLRIPRVPVQYRDAEILEVITQPIGNFIRADETTLSGLNGLFMKVLLEVYLRLPLKMMMRSALCC